MTMQFAKHTTMVAMVVMAMLALAAGPALAQDAAPAGTVEKVQQTQAKLLAKRAAQADAYRNLAEQVRGLRITSSTFVKDFVAESDTIATSVDAFLRGAKMVGEPRYMEDGSCEVTMELALATVQAELINIYKAQYKGDKYKINDFQQLTVTNKIEKITVTGNGAPRAIGMEQYNEEGQPVPGLSLNLPDAWKGIPAQARLMAKRAAQVDAYRNLAEQVMGLRLTSSTFVRDFVAESDNIKTDLDTFLKGAKVAEVRYMNDLSVEVDVKLALAKLVGELRREYEAHYKGDKYKIRDFEELNAKVEIQWVTATGTGLPPEKYLTGRTTTSTTVVAGPQVPDWVKNTVKATGSGVKPETAENEAQAKLMALRAAKLDAMRNISEQINGLRIDANTTVKDFVATNDQIRTEMDNYLTGVKTVSEKYDATTGEAQVEIEAPLEQFWNIVVKYRKEVRIESR